MRPWVLGFFCALVLPCSVQGFAQQAVPRTLEALAQTVEAENAPSAPEAEQKDAGPKRPAGTLVRPKDGVKHPDLDRAWADYDATVAKATEAITFAIGKQFDAAAAKGDLDGVEKWQKLQEKFEKAGDTPVDKETKAVVSQAVIEYKKARDGLAKAYEAVVRSLTIEKQITDAKAVRDEYLLLVQPANAAKQADQQLINKGLVLCYLFDRDLHEKAVDSSGKENHGRVHGATWVAKGRRGGCMSFDGGDDYIDAGNAQSLTMRGGEVSVAAWLKPSAMRGRIVCKRRQGFDYICDLNPDGMGFAFHDHIRSQGEGLGANCRANGEWEHFAWVSSKESVSFFLNGQLLAAKQKRHALPANPQLSVWIGADQDCGFNTQWVYGGLMDEVMIWDRCLSEREIKSLAEVR